MTESLSIEQILQKPLQELLPHNPPMVLLNKVLSLDAEKQSISCSACFGNDGFFGNSLGVPIPWTVEIIAQACALFVSVSLFGTGITEGRLLKCRSFRFQKSYLRYDQTYVVDAKLKLAGDSGLWIFDGQITDSHGEIWAIGDMSILVK